jgi:hypothetical protein
MLPPSSGNPEDLDLKDPLVFRSFNIAVSTEEVIKDRI